MAKWYPLVQAEPIRNPARIEAIIAHARKIAEEAGRPFDEERIRRTMADELSLPVYKSFDYQVAVRRTPIAELQRGDGKEGPVFLVHMSIKRIDQRPIRDWRDLQRIKNQLLGEECEAMELFPAESRLVDTANQYHLWGYDDPSYHAPFGFEDGRMVDDTAGPETGTRQRKFGG